MLEQINFWHLLNCLISIWKKQRHKRRASSASPVASSWRGISGNDAIQDSFPVQTCRKQLGNSERIHIYTSQQNLRLQAEKWGGRNDGLHELCKQRHASLLCFWLCMILESMLWPPNSDRSRGRLWNWAHGLWKIHHSTVSGERVCLTVTCLQMGGKKKRKKRGLGWAFFLASLSSLEVESFPPSPSLRAAGPRSGNKTG